MNEFDDPLNEFDGQEDGISGFYDDDGNKINPDLIPKPPLCLSCVNDERSDQQTLCTLTRLDQKDELEFACYAYNRKKL